MLFTTSTLLSLLLAGFAAAAPSLRDPISLDVVNCDIVGVHTPGRSPPSPGRVAIDISFALSESLWALSDWSENDDPLGGVWGDRVTHTTREDGRLDVKATNYRVGEATIQEVKEHLESLAGHELPSGNFAKFAVDEISCVIVERD